MRIGAVACVVAFVAGCSIGCHISIRSDPTAGPWPIGTEAMIYRDPAAGGRFDGDDTTMARMGVAEGTGVIGLDFLNVRVGTRVRIIDDPRAKPDDREPVTVRVIEGPNADRVGTIPRDDLRPIPRQPVR